MADAVFERFEYNPPDPTHDRFIFWCPGCTCCHWVCTRGDPKRGPVWEFNGDVIKPTISPSLLVRSRDATGDTVCHSFIRNGQIEFLGDCTHALRGQTVALTPVIDR